MFTHGLRPRPARRAQPGADHRAGHRPARPAVRRLAVAVVAAAGALALPGLASAGTAAATAAGSPRCDAGEFCAWGGEYYEGATQRLDVEAANPGQCVPLSDGFVGR